MRTATLLLAVSMLLAGCGAQPKPEQGTTKARPKKPSTASQVIDGMTGVSAVRAGEKAKDRIRQVSAQKNSDLDEALGE